MAGRHRHRHPWGLPGFLWTLALLIVAAGGSLALVLHPDVGIRYSRATLHFVVAATAVLAGLCVIAATANWWLRR